MIGGWYNYTTFIWLLIYFFFNGLFDAIFVGFGGRLNWLFSTILWSDVVDCLLLPCSVILLYEVTNGDLPLCIVLNI